MKKTIALILSVLFISSPLAYSYYQDGAGVFVSSGAEIRNKVLREVGDFAVLRGDVVEFRIADSGIPVNISDLPENAVLKDGIFSWDTSNAENDEYDLVFSCGGENEKVTVFILAPVSDKDNSGFAEKTGDGAARVADEVENLENRAGIVKSVSGITNNVSSLSAHNFSDNPKKKDYSGKKGDNLTLKGSAIVVANGISNFRGEPAENISRNRGQALNISKKTGSMSNSDSKIESKGPVISAVRKRAAGGSMLSKSVRTERRVHAVKPSVSRMPVYSQIAAPLFDEYRRIVFSSEYEISWNGEGDYYVLEESSDERFENIIKTYKTRYKSVVISHRNRSVKRYYYRVKAAKIFNGEDIFSPYSDVIDVIANYEKSVDLTKLRFNADSNSDVTVNKDFAEICYVLLGTDKAVIDIPFEYPVDMSQINSVCVSLKGDEKCHYPYRIVAEAYSGEKRLFSTSFRGINGNWNNYILPFAAGNVLADGIRIIISHTRDDECICGRFFIGDFFFSSDETVIEPDIEKSRGAVAGDTELLDKIESDGVKYFLNERFGSVFVKRDTLSDISDIRGIAFLMLALVASAERNGTSEYWDTGAVYYAKEVRRILDVLIEIQKEQAVNIFDYGISGFFPRYFNKSGKRADGALIYPRDTAFVVASAIVCGEYFGGDIKEKAEELKANVNWEFFIDDEKYLFYKYYDPEKHSLSYGEYEGSYNGGLYLLSLIALSCNKNSKLFRMAYYSYRRAGADFIETDNGSVNSYMLPHLFVNFKDLGDEKDYFVNGAVNSRPVDIWENTRDALLFQYGRYSELGRFYRFTFGNNCWGVNPVLLPDGKYEDKYGFMTDGVLDTDSSLAALVFFDENGLSENIAFKPAKYFYENYFDLTYGRYGFYDSIGPYGRAGNEYTAYNLGIVFSMIENYRSGLFQNLFMENESIKDVLSLVFPGGFNWLDVEIMNINDNAVSGELEFGSYGVGAGKAPSLQYVKLSYNFMNPDGKLVIYTDNMASSNPYTGDEDPAGLVGVVNSELAAPLYWEVYDEVQPKNNILSHIENAGKVQDAGTFGFDFDDDMLIRRTVIDGWGELAPYPDPGRRTASSSLYLYFALDFTGLRAQEYRTDSLTFEIYQE